jgi:hypothetical protein
MTELDDFKNVDGTYTSPRNNKVYKTLKSFRAHWHYAGHVKSDTLSKRLYKTNCQFCCEEIGISNLKKHERTCYLNPSVLTECKVCSKPIKNYKESKGTCSYSCANIYFRSGESNGNWQGNSYKSICFLHHDKKCVVCGENKIVAVHHYDYDHSNNDPANLIPMCPTHHQYVHSRYAKEVLPIIEEYIKEWIQLGGRGVRTPLALEASKLGAAPGT